MIKKTKKSEYKFSSIWIRNPYDRHYLDINHLFSESDYNLIANNENINLKSKYNLLDKNKIQKKKILIVSDGYKFKENHYIATSLPKDVCIIAVNGALNSWELIEDNPHKRAISYYVINNPYSASNVFFPNNKYLPNCIASTRTNSDFLKKYNQYKRNVYLYVPVDDKKYSSPFKNYNYRIDDYRNPICAAINLSVQFEVEKLSLLCCDDSFDEYKEGAIKLPNGLYHYPQHNLAHKIIDGCLYWLKNNNVEIVNCSSGPNLENASYIKLERLKDFFNE